MVPLNSSVYCNLDKHLPENAMSSSGVGESNRKSFKQVQKWMHKLEECWESVGEEKCGQSHSSTSCSSSLLDALPSSSLVNFGGNDRGNTSFGDKADGFLILNGETLLPSCSPYDIRELLIYENVISVTNTQESLICSSPSLPFVLVLHPLPKENFFASVSVEVQPAAAVHTSSLPLDMQKTDRGRKNCEAAVKASRHTGFSEFGEKRTVYLLPLSATIRQPQHRNTSNSIGEALFLIPCSLALVIEHIGNRFSRPVVGITADVLLDLGGSKYPSSVKKITTDKGSSIPREIVSVSIPEIPGLFVWNNFLTQKEHEDILQEMKNTDVLKFQYLQRRRVAHFNRRFLYGVNQVGAEGEEVNDPPTFFQWMQRRLYCQDDSVSVVGPLPPSFGSRYCDQLTANYYEYTGKSKEMDLCSSRRHVVGIAPHVDSHSAFMDHIFVVSLGSYTVMNFRRWDHPPGVVTPVYVAPRSLIIMSGEARYGWVHSISEKLTDLLSESFPPFYRGDRLSLTWRVSRDAPHFKSTCLYPSLCDGVNEDNVEKNIRK